MLQASYHRSITLLPYRENTSSLKQQSRSFSSQVNTKFGHILPRVHFMLSSLSLNVYKQCSKLY